MRVADDGKVWVRQSWLNDIMICPERSRLAVTMPEWRMGSDATHIGTAVHAGIEHYLTHDEVEKSYWVANAELERLVEEEPFRINSTNGIAHMGEYVITLMNTFHSDVAPSVTKGGVCEQKFGVKLYDLPEDTSLPFDAQPSVWLGGTIDYIDPDGIIWDWKTAGRKYYQGEKQRQSIQASAYAYACVENGWSPGYPVRFNYGVMTRTSKSVGQIVPVIRTQHHVDWFKHQVQSVLQSCLSLGVETPWMANDQHGLCSEKWCPYWSICKGSRLSDIDNNLLEVNNG
jgi:hypothetical protein